MQKNDAALNVINTEDLTKVQGGGFGGFLVSTGIDVLKSFYKHRGDYYKGYTEGSR